MQTLLERSPDISVIIPAYNLEKHLTPMLISLLAQDYGEYTHEIIFVLNNCTDDSEGVIRRSGLDCTIINCTKQGCGPARNAGFDISTGKYIWFMDGDDWLLSATAIRDVLDAVGDEGIIRIPFMSEHFRWQYFSMVWQYLMKRDFIEEFRFPDYQPSEDDAYTAAVLRKAGYDKSTHLLLPCVNHALYYYNYGREGSNMMRVARGEKI